MLSDWITDEAVNKPKVEVEKNAEAKAPRTIRNLSIDWGANSNKLNSIVYNNNSKFKINVIARLTLQPLNKMKCQNHSHDYEEEPNKWEKISINNVSIYNIIISNCSMENDEKLMYNQEHTWIDVLYNSYI